MLSWLYYWTAVLSMTGMEAPECSFIWRRDLYYCSSDGILGLIEEVKFFFLCLSSVTRDFGEAITVEAPLPCANFFASIIGNL